MATLQIATAVEIITIMRDAARVEIVKAEKANDRFGATWNKSRELALTQALDTIEAEAR